MIQINLLIPDELRHLVDVTDTESFRIISRGLNSGMGIRFYVVEIPEEDLVVLTLKLGTRFVWRR